VRLPRDVTGRELAARLASRGYSVTGQRGSHIRLTTQMRGQHHITIPEHDPLRVGTLAAILSDVAAHFEISRDDLLEELFGGRG
jgi:predicted RNA binding protein YcfA (HicA-like mRNA interferase family)